MSKFDEFDLDLTNKKVRGVTAKPDSVITTSTEICYTASEVTTHIVSEISIHTLSLDPSACCPSAGCTVGCTNNTKVTCHSNLNC